MSSSQLTFSPSFFRGVGFSHQPVMDLYLNRPENAHLWHTGIAMCVKQANEATPNSASVRRCSSHRWHPVQWQNKGQGRNHPEARQLLQPNRNLQPGRAPSGNCWCTATSSRSAQKSTCPRGSSGQFRRWIQTSGWSVSKNSTTTVTRAKCPDLHQKMMKSIIIKI